MPWLSFDIWSSSHTWCSQWRLHWRGRWTPFVVVTSRRGPVPFPARVGALSVG